MPDNIDPDGRLIARLDTKNTKLSYQCIASDRLPEERDSRYLYSDFSFEDIYGETVGITPVYYIAGSTE